MLKFCENLIRNEAKKNILNDPTLCFLLNKKELKKIYFYLIKNNPCVIRFIENPTEEMKWLAIKQDERVIQFIKNPTEEMKWLAIKQNGEALQFIKNPTDEIRSC